MIPSEIMDKIIRVPDEEEETEAKIEELKEAGFVITNFSKGGVFYILLRIAIHIGVQPQTAGRGSDQQCIYETLSGRLGRDQSCRLFQDTG